MLTNLDMSLVMHRYLESAVSFMKKKGYILPSLVVLNKGVPLDLEVSHRAVLEVASNMDESDLITPDEDEIYEYGIAFKLNKNYRDEFLLEVAKKVAKDSQPDAIGAISACLYRDFSEDNLPLEVDIQKDTEAIRVLSLSYFLKGDPTPNFMVLPYTKRAIENPGWGEDAFAIHTISTSWNTGIDANDVIMSYPYL